MNSCVNFKVLHYAKTHFVSVFFVQFPLRLQSVSDLVRKSKLPFLILFYRSVWLERAVLVNELRMVSQKALTALVTPSPAFGCLRVFH